MIPILFTNHALFNFPTQHICKIICASDTCQNIPFQLFIPNGFPQIVFFDELMFQFKNVIFGDGMI